MAKIIELIYTEERTGLWTDDNPVRMKKQLRTKDWQLVAEEWMNGFDNVFLKLEECDRKVCFNS